MNNSDKIACMGVDQCSDVFRLCEPDIALLKKIYQRLAPHRQQLADSLCEYLLNCPGLRALFSQPDAVDRLREIQRRNLDRLTGGDCPSDMTDFGLVDQHVEVDPRWHIGAYRKYLTDLVPVLLLALKDEPDVFSPACDALLKLACLDMLRAFDTYRQNDREEIARAESYTDQIVAEMPSGLVVLDARMSILAINRAMCRMSGVSSAVSVLGKPLSTAISSERLTQQVRLALDAGIEQQEFAVPISVDGGVRHIEFNMSGALLSEGNILLLIAQDVTERMRSQEELRRFRMALDSSIDAVYLIDHERMRFVDANKTALTTLGYSYEELLMLGPQDLKPDPGELQRIHRRFAEVIGSESKTGMIETVHQRKDGVRLPVEVYLRAIQSEGRQLLVAVVRDITARLEAEAVLRESEERFRVAFNQAAVGLAHVNPDGRWTMVNNKLCEIVGYSQTELLTLGFPDITHPEDVIADWALARRMIAGELDEKTREKRYRHKDGHYIWVNVTTSLVRDKVGNPKYYSTVVEDISRRKQIEEELLHLANHDSLTSLPNRSLLFDRLSQALVFAGRSGRQVAVLLIDLDRFKNINDSLGHETGDKIIMEIGRRLSSCVRTGDSIARFGGDEFVVIRPDVVRADAVATLAQQILEVLSQPMAIQDHEFYPTASIGISMFPKDGRDSQALLKNADTAMYRAKDAGRNTFQFYAHEMNSRALDRLKLESGMRRALERNEFVLHYQPQMDIATGEINGVEALLRWAVPGRAMRFPADFISIAEESGMISAIGEWVLRAACTQRKAWQGHDVLSSIRIAVNLSARQFKQQDIVKVVSVVLEQTGCRPEWLELEITESVIMENPEAAAETLRKLSDMGVHLAIDDFGTGYSSLSYLKRFPIDALKIDKSFVCDITSDTDDAAIARAVIALAHSLKLQVIAEGVETLEQLDFLREQQCDHMQGYYLSPPLSVQNLEGWLAERASPPDH